MMVVWTSVGIERDTTKPWAEDWINELDNRLGCDGKGGRMPRNNKRFHLLGAS